MKGKVLKILAVLGCLTLTAGVVACGGKKDDDKKTSSSESSSFNWWNSSSESSSFNWWISSSESSSFNWWNSSSESSESSSLSAVESSSNEVNSGESSGANSSSEEILPEEDKITFTTLSVDGNNVYGKVSNETETFAFADEIEVSGSAKYIVSLDEFGVQTVITKTVPLAVGDNVVYIFETVDEEITATYVVTVRRRPIHEVTFNTNGGSPALMQEIEEDDFATEPETAKTGYTFAGWDYDFSQPITESIEIAAQWTANEDTQYTVNYYWQNIADDEYTLHESEALTGTTDTTATATIKQYDHFAYAEEESTISGNIEADGSLTLDVYYTRNVYSVSTTANNTDAGTYTEINAEYRYGQEITLTATPYVGYTCYWYDGETLAGEGQELSCIVEKDVVYTVQFDVAPEMANFDFTPTQDSCVITGMKDKTVTEIVIPDCVTGITEGAFAQCFNVTKLSVSQNVTGIDESTFADCNNLTDVTAPIGIIENIEREKLQSVEITAGETIPASLFENCSDLTKIVIPESVTSIGDRAFKGCNSLTEIAIPDSVISVGNYLFEGCYHLQYTIKDGLKYLGNPDNPYLYLAKTVTTNITSATIENSCRFISSNAFYNCRSLTSATFGENSQLMSIGLEAFATCYSLANIYIMDIMNWCSVSGLGNLMQYGSGYKNLYLNNELITKLVIPDGVTNIDSGAFEEIDSLMEIVIPNSVISIGRKVFEGCNNLTIYCESESQPEGWDIDWNSSNRPVVWDCNNNDVADDGYTYIVADGLRYGLKGGVATVVEQPSSIMVANIPKTVTYKDTAYTVTSIGDNAFASCRSLTSIVIPEGVMSIGGGAFASCENLTEIVIPEGVTSIGSGAFSFCSNLTKIEIPDSVTSIASGAFSYCGVQCTEKDGLQYLGNPDNPYIYLVHGGGIAATIENGCKFIDGSAFKYCGNLREIVIPESVTSIGSDVFSDCYYLTIYCEVKNKPSGWVSNWNFNRPVVWDCKNNDTATDGYIYPLVDGVRYALKAGIATVVGLPSSITVVNIPETVTYKGVTYSVTSIGERAFYSCYNLTEIVIPDSVTRIGEWAFYGCISLTSVTFGENSQLTRIGNDVFFNCYNLTEIEIPDSVTYIGEDAFYYCYSLTSITFDGTMEQWNNVRKGSDWNDYVPATVVVCSDGNVEL